MGCIGSVCCISGLHIGGGDAIRIFLMTQSPFAFEDRPQGMNGVWFPRTFPLKATYDDYGGAENVEEGPQKDVWLEGLAIDAVPRGWGENSCHDVPTAKKMSFKQVMKSVWEQRLFVRDDAEVPLFPMFDELSEKIRLLLEKHGDPLPEEPKKPKKTVAKGIPTRARVEALLVKAKLPLYGDKDPDGPGTTNGTSSPGYLVSKVRFGQVRVRFQSWEGHVQDAEKLATAATVLDKRYATVVFQSLLDSQEAELLVFPKPGTKYNSPNRQRKRVLKVALGMVREDVWQALLSVPLPGMRMSPAKVIERKLKDPWPRGFDLGGLGLGAHARLLEKTKPLPPEAIQTAAEFAYLHSLLNATGYYWRPGYTGPQSGEWKTHVKLLKALTKVAENGGS